MEKEALIELTLKELISQWPDEEYDTLNNGDKGYLISHGQCSAFAKEAIYRLEKNKIVNPEDITVVEWYSNTIFLHAFIIIGDKAYDSMLTKGIDVDKIKDLFTYHSVLVKLKYDKWLVLAKDRENEVFDPWNLEGLARETCSESRYTGREYINSAGIK